jgi:hypothetical protein
MAAQSGVDLLVDQRMRQIAAGYALELARDGGSGRADIHRPAVAVDRQAIGQHGWLAQHDRNRAPGARKGGGAVGGTRQVVGHDAQRGKAGRHRQRWACAWGDCGYR